MSCPNKGVRGMKPKRMGWKSCLLIIVATALLGLPDTLRGVTNSDYSALPPFMATAIPPNVLIVLDNSGSMCSGAYLGSYDPSQFSSGKYYGYFDSTKYYQYTSNGRWEPISGYTTSDPIPSSGPEGAASTSYPIASGDFLNWATMRRVDIAKKLLIGGKADPRSPSGSVTVKLLGEDSCSWSWNFQKDYDNSSNPNLIAPFSGNYRYRVTSSADLYIEPVSSGSSTTNLLPLGDISLPSGWYVYPSSPATAYDKVDEASSDGNTTYIEARNTTSPVLFDYNYTGSASGTISSVSVKVVVKKSSFTWAARKIRAVLRIGGANYESYTSNIGNWYNTYTFTWTANPATGNAWSWSDIKSNGVGSIEAFGVKSFSAYSSAYPRVTKIYLVVSTSTPSGGPYNIIIDQGMQKAEGIIDRLGNDARFGLAFYNHGCGVECGYSDGRRDGAYVKEYIDFGVSTDMITAIQNMVPNTWTPLAESLYEMVRYFKQDSPYYNNSPADYQVGSNYDPYNYQYSKIDPSLSDQYVPCAKSFILLLTDGESTKDENIPSSLRDYDSDSSDPGSYPYDGTDYLDDVALWARTNDMRSDLESTQNIILYTVFMFGKGSDLLKDAAINGGFEDRNGNNKPDCSADPEECYRDSDGDGTVESNGDDNPLTYFEGDDGFELEKSITNAIASILKRSASGTSVSILATSQEGEGALYQAYFYPEKIMDDGSKRKWLGYCRGFFLDSSGNLREDTNGDQRLIYKDDRIMSMYLDTSTNEVKVNLYTDLDEDGVKDAGTPTTVGIDDTFNLWEAGKKLALRDKDTRKVYTWVDLDADGVVDNGDFASPTGEAMLFSSTNASTLKPYLRAADDTEATNIIDYIRGKPVTGYRNRCISISGATQETGCSGSNERSWVLGDIVYSTPTVVASPREQYDLIYGDSTYTAFRNKYASRRNVVYLGANDGMLHAFNAGVYTAGDDSSTTDTEHGWFIDNPTTGNGWTSPTPDIGDELWAFVPYDNLPHLKWLTSSDYNHVYYVDLKPKVTDARIFNNTETGDCPGNVSGLVDGQNNVCHPNGWGTILIMGLRFGGGAIDVDLNGDTDTSDPGEQSFRSAYYAFDITDPEKPPRLLWRFTDSDLGFTTSYPAIIHFKATNTTPEKWYMVVGSGPDNNVPTGTRGYDGTSTRAGKIYIVDLKTGQAVKTFTTTDTNAFMGDPTVVDVDLDYDGDVIYIGSVVSKTSGKIYRITTGEDPDPNNWTLSLLFDTGQPVLVAPSIAKDSLGNLWVYFGTGRLFDSTDKTNSDQQSFYGIKDGCWDGSCTTTYTLTDLIETTAVKVSSDTGASDQVSGSTTVCGGNTTCSFSTMVTTIRTYQGWYINLNNPTTPSERVLSPAVIVGGILLFTTFTPNSDICAMLGESAVYALYYETGTAYKKPIIGTETIGGTEYIRKSMSIGKGMPTTIGVAIGKETKGFIQTSTGTIVEVETEVTGGRSEPAAWREESDGGEQEGIEMLYKHVVK